MPELPEVETIRRIVSDQLTGRRVESVELTLPKLMRASPIASLAPIVGESVEHARRRAKILMIEFSNDLTLLIHFKLSGQLAVLHPNGGRGVAGHPVPDPLGPYPHRATHVIFQMSGDVTVYYSDVRQFGWLRLLPSIDVNAAINAFGFGPEAGGDVDVDAVALALKLARRSVPIKLALLDQTVLAGLGNIYVDEALYAAEIHPTTPANQLDEPAIARLAETIPWALDEGLAQGGARIIHQRAFPQNGFPRVHGRQGLDCPHCGATIAKIRVGSRGTYLCPNCQTLPTVENRIPR
jgi:formamidopyrimidine-DNA glycosylase